MLFELFSLRRASVVVVLLALVSTLTPFAPVLAGSVSLSVVNWDVDTDNGLVTYDVTMTAEGGGVCAPGTCYYQIQAAYLDAGAENIVATLASGSRSFSSSDSSFTFSAHAAAELIDMPEITHVRANVNAYGGDPSVSTGWISVAPSYPDGNVTLQVLQWVPDQDSGLVDYDLKMVGTGLGGWGEPCESTCYFQIEGGADRGSGLEYVHSFTAGKAATGRAWRLEKLAQGVDVNLPEITHVRARVYRYGGTPQRDSGWQLVRGIGDFDDDFVANARLALLVEGVGEGTLRALRSVSPAKLEAAFLGMPCPSTNPSSLNDCHYAFLTALAAGMSVATAIAIVYEAFREQMQDMLEEVIGADPEAPTGEPTYRPVPPPVFDSGDINEPIQPAPWHATSDHAEVVDEYALVAHYLRIETAWLSDVACRHTIEIGDQLAYPEWYGCVHVRLLRVTDPSLTIQDALSAFVTQFGSREAAEAALDRLIEDGLAQQEPEHEDFGPEPVTDASSGYAGGTNDPCDGESMLPIRYRTEEGRVDLTTEDLTDDEVEMLIRQARILNSYIARFGPVIAQRTSGTIAGEALGRAGRLAAAAERERAGDAGDPYLEFVAGHSPDASFANRGDSPCGWDRLTVRVNSKVGGHWSSRVQTGVPITHVTVDAVVPGEVVPVSNLPGLP